MMKLYVLSVHNREEGTRLICRYQTIEICVSRGPRPKGFPKGVQPIYVRLSFQSGEDFSLSVGTRGEKGKKGDAPDRLDIGLSSSLTTLAHQNRRCKDN